MANSTLRSVLLLASTLYLLGNVGCASREPFRLDSAFGKKSDVKDPKLAKALQTMKQARDKAKTANGDYSIDTSDRVAEITKKAELTRGKSNSFGGKIKQAASSTASYMGGAFRPAQNATSSYDPVSLSHNPGPLNPDIFVKAATHFEGQNNPAAAFEQYQKAIAINPTYKPALLGQGRLFHREGKMQESIQTYQTALAAYPMDAVVLNDLALCYARMKDFDQAISSMQLAVKAKPESQLYRNNLAAVFVEAGRPADAVTTLAEVHGPAIANYNVGYLLNHRDQSVEARHYFDKALSFDPNMEQARTMLARMNVNSNQNPLPRGLPLRSPTDISGQPETLQARRPMRNDYSSTLPPIVLPHQVPNAGTSAPQYETVMAQEAAPFNYQTAAKSFARVPDPVALAQPSDLPHLLPAPTETLDPMQQVLKTINQADAAMADPQVSAASYVVPKSNMPSEAHAADQQTPLRMPTLNSRRRGQLVPPTPIGL